jgi:hypothetical protein
VSFTGDLLNGLAQLLADGGAGTYRSDGTAYLPSETAIAFAAMPQTPDRAIVLATYTVTDDASLSDSAIGVQVRCRGGVDPHDVEAVAAAVFDLLHGATAYQAGAVRVVQSLHQSGAPLGRDDSNRWERSENYYLTVHRPSAHRT